ncbi:cupin domain-containing protein [Streptomyces sp. NPDC000151]|uniref:cupin domain-containing protein n=1 Tax=Streptomyces sp. NPDC000151 TaxID=3154244 RepID=UPI0033214FDD
MNARPPHESWSLPDTFPDPHDLQDWGLRPGADRGAPQQHGLRLVGTERALPEAGLWQCTPGSWPLRDIPYTEFVHMLHGHSLITDADGRTTELRPGDVLVLPRGWSGRWEVVETTRKLYFRS